MQFLCNWASGSRQRAGAQTVASSHTKVAMSLPQHFVCIFWTCIIKIARFSVRYEPLTLELSQRPGSLAGIVQNVPVSRCQHHRFEIIFSTQTPIYMHIKNKTEKNENSLIALLFKDLDC